MDTDQALEPPDVQTADVDAPADADQQSQGTTLPFDLNEIDDDFSLSGAEAREWLTTRQAQLQAPVTRRSQELAVEREQVAAMAELQQRLEDGDTREEALQQLAQMAGVELEFQTDAEEEPEYTDPLEAEVAELRAWRAEQERTQQEAVDAQGRQSAEQKFNGHAIEEMTRIAGQLGTTLDAMTLADRGDIVARALAAPQRPDGLPDFDAGLAAHLEYREQVLKAERARYAASKDGMDPRVNGGSGVKVANLRSTRDRLAAGLAAADKHYSTQ